MKPIVAFIFGMSLISTHFSYSQELDIDPDLQLTAKDSIVKSAWVFGIGFNAVDDSGDVLDQLFSFEEEWNAVPYPSRLNVGRYFSSGIGVEAIGSFNRYKKGKEVDNSELLEDVNYYAIDGRVTYAINKIWGGSGWFDPYVGGGVGYTDANHIGRGTWNGVVGFKTWLSDRFGLDFNSTGKWAMDTDKASNHIQHAVSGLYRFGINKGLTKKGEEKLQKLQELEKEQQRVHDSIASAMEAEEQARLLAERLAKEKEAARLAAEKAAEAARKAQLEKEIKDYGNIYFALNSSYLNKPSKVVLDKVVDFLVTNETIKLKVSSHTDSRGNDTYNQWLSERRVERTVKYIVSKGISEDRLNAVGLGETHLVNECDNQTNCAADKHRENRRSEFIVIEF